MLGRGTKIEGTYKIAIGLFMGLYHQVGNLCFAPAALADQLVCRCIMMILVRDRRLWAWVPHRFKHHEWDRI